MKVYDIVIIGSGAGLHILEIALQKGLTCALVERSKFGGTCLTRGCIPSKILVYPADVIREAEHAMKTGLKFKLVDIDWKTISERMWSQIDEGKDIERNADQIETLTTYKGTGEFTGQYTMKVKLNDNSYSEEFNGKKFVIAAGGRPFTPSLEGLQETGYLDFESFFGAGFPNKPWKSLAIIGGGAIGTEFAHMFSAFGTKVTIVEMLPNLVSTEDKEISTMLENQFKENGIDIFTNSKVVKVLKDNRMKTLMVQNLLTDETTSITCDEIFVAAGIRSNADLLKIENSGVKTDEKGWIITNEYMETTQRNIWALGDINGKYQFRHKANYEAEICADNIFNIKNAKRMVDYSRVPWAIYTYPQIAHIGLTEAEVRSKRIRYLVGKNHYSLVAKGFAMGYVKGDLDDGFVKLITDEKMKILGAHIVGPHAVILIQSLVYLMNTGSNCKIDERKGLFRNVKTIHNEIGTIIPLGQSMVIHPSLSEVVGWIVSSMEWSKQDDINSIDSE